jgi:hypothetical protein
MREAPRDIYRRKVYADEGKGGGDGKQRVGEIARLAELGKAGRLSSCHPLFSLNTLIYAQISVQNLGGEPVRKWPRSRWAQAGIAFASSLILAAVFGRLAERFFLDYNLRTNGGGGFSALGAAMGGFAVAFWTFPISFVLIFGAQWAATGLIDKGEVNDQNPAEPQ